MKQPILVSSVDGVGTKLKIAFAMDRHDTIGEDLGEPLRERHRRAGRGAVVLPRLPRHGKLEPHVFHRDHQGLRARLRGEQRCSLIGGETAQMPGFYQAGEYDVSGTIVGVVDKPRMLDGKTIRPGDVVIGLEASGLHTNGYSLARKIFFEDLKLKPKTRVR
jgi:phosphoribosylformylglycinamidine cyclo-ligase